MHQDHMPLPAGAGGALRPVSQADNRTNRADAPIRRAKRPNYPVSSLVRKSPCPSYPRGNPLFRRSLVVPEPSKLALLSAALATLTPPQSAASRRDHDHRNR